MLSLVLSAPVSMGSSAGKAQSPSSIESSFYEDFSKWENLGKVALLPYMEPSFRSSVKKDIESSKLPHRAKKMLADGRYAALSLWALHTAGWGRSSVKQRIRDSQALFLGMIQRPLRKDELALLTPAVNKDMTWLSVDGLVLKRSLDDELSIITTGMNLSKSYGLTRAGRVSAENASLPIFEKWTEAPFPKSTQITILSILLMLMTGGLISVLLDLSSRQFSDQTYSTSTSLKWIIASVALAWALSVAFPDIVLWLDLYVAMGALVVATIFATMPCSASLLFHLRQKRPRALIERWHLFSVIVVVSTSAILVFLAKPVVYGGFVTLVLALVLPTFSYKTAIYFGFLETKSALFRNSILPVVFTTWSICVTTLAIVLPWLVESHLTVESATSDSLLFAFGGTALVALSMVATSVFVVATPFVVQFCKMRFGNKAKAGSEKCMGFSVKDLNVMLACVAFSLIASSTSLLKGDPRETMPLPSSVKWEEALLEAETGVAVIVDTRLPGSYPEIKSFANLDPDSSDDFLRDFCSFASGKKVYVFCATSSCDISKNLASRMHKLCPSGVKYIEGGAETWLGK